MPKIKSSFKKGATSIYVVVISTLLFSVITVSFIRIVINETNNTINDELAQSAYDSALAGVEDSKVALKQYYECVEAGGISVSQKCKTVIESLEAGFGDTDKCDSVSKALGRITVDKDEVLIKEDDDATAGTVDDQRKHIIQAYTCVTIDNTPSDFLTVLGGNHTIRVIPLKTQDPDSITGIRIRWHKDDDSNSTKYSYDDDGQKFGPLGNGLAPTPPTLSAQIIQTAQKFTFAQFDNSDGNSTNRGTVILVPSKKTTGTINHIPASTLVASNNHSYERTDSNTPQVIRCENASLSDQYACVASIEMPTPIATNGDQSRNQDTFFLVLSLPYGEPSTTVSIQLCTDGASSSSPRGDCRNADGSESTADFQDVQIAVDSTGRANDMLTRVEARVEFIDTEFPYPEFALQASSNEDDAIKKDFYVTQNCIQVDPTTGAIVPCSH